jgi:hypothetical protein
MLKSIRLKLLGFLHRLLATWLWVKEYRKTVCRSGVYMLLIRKGRKKMSEEQDWIYDIVPKAQIESMNLNAKKIEKNMSGGITIVLSSDNESAMELCRYWKNALHGDAMSWIKISSFMAGIIETVEIHLSEEGINPYED